LLTGALPTEAVVVSAAGKAPTLPLPQGRTPHLHTFFAESLALAKMLPFFLIFFFDFNCKSKNGFNDKIQSSK
jgi:hypothetical protein